MSVDRTEHPDGRRSWLVAVVGAVAMVFTFGTPLSYGVLREPFSEAFAIPSVTLSVVFAVMLCTFYIGSGLVGVFGTRFPARSLLLVCSFATVVLAPMLYLTGSVIGLAVVFAVLGLALGTVFVLVASVVPRWFDERRGTATGLIFVGNGLGLFVLPPLWQFVLAEFGVRSGFLLIVSLSAFAFFLAGLVCRRPRWAKRSTATADELLEWLAGLAGARRFQLLFVGMALSFAWYPLLAAYAVDLFVHRGLTETAAAAAFGLVGGVSIVSRIGGGYVADRVGSRRTFVAALVVTIVGSALFVLPVLLALPVAIVLTGIGLGALATLYIPLLMELYSPEKDTAIVGTYNVAIGIAALAMPPLGTASITYTDGFTVAIALTVLLTVVGLWAIVRGTGRS